MTFTVDITQQCDIGTFRCNIIKFVKMCRSLMICDESLVPEKIYQFENLQILILFNCPLYFLPPEIKTLISITKIVIKKCELIQISENIGLLKKLEKLDVSANNLYEFPETIGDLNNLKHLIFDSNQFEIFPKEISNLCNLIVLSFEKNKIKNLPQNLTKLKKLKTFNCVANPLVDECYLIIFEISQSIQLVSESYEQTQHPTVLDSLILSSQKFERLDGSGDPFDKSWNLKSKSDIDDPFDRSWNLKSKSDIQKLFRLKPTRPMRPMRPIEHDTTKNIFKEIRKPESKENGIIIKHQPDTQEKIKPKENIITIRHQMDTKEETKPYVRSNKKIIIKIEDRAIFVWQIIDRCKYIVQRKFESDGITDDFLMIQKWKEMVIEKLLENKISESKIKYWIKYIDSVYTTDTLELHKHLWAIIFDVQDRLQTEMDIENPFFDIEWRNRIIETFMKQNFDPTNISIKNEDEKNKTIAILTDTNAMIRLVEKWIKFIDDQFVDIDSHKQTSVILSMIREAKNIVRNVFNKNFGNDKRLSDLFCKIMFRTLNIYRFPQKIIHEWMMFINNSAQKI